jgi:hypothetical protein
MELSRAARVYGSAMFHIAKEIVANISIQKLTSFGFLLLDGSNAA